MLGLRLRVMCRKLSSPLFNCGFAAVAATKPIDQIEILNQHEYDVHGRHVVSIPVMYLKEKQDQRCSDTFGVMSEEYLNELAGDLFAAFVCHGYFCST